MAAAARVAVLGGTGATGAECVYQLLKEGHHVDVLARTPSKLGLPPGSCGEDKAGLPFDGVGEAGALTVVQGNATVQADVDAVITAETTGVIVSLGGKTKDVGPTMLTDATTCVVNACRAKGVKRVCIVTSIGVGDSADQAPFFFKILMGTVMRSIFTDKGKQEALFMEGPGSDLEWCIVRPGGLGLGPPTGVINVIDGEAGSIARADVAAFCLGAVLDAAFPYIGKTPCISSVGGTGWVKDRGDKGMFEA